MMELGVSATWQLAQVMLPLSERSRPPCARCCDGFGASAQQQTSSGRIEWIEASERRSNKLGQATLAGAAHPRIGARGNARVGRVILRIGMNEVGAFSMTADAALRSASRWTNSGIRGRHPSIPRAVVSRRTSSSAFPVARRSPLPRSIRVLVPSCGARDRAETRHRRVPDEPARAFRAAKRAAPS